VARKNSATDRTVSPDGYVLLWMPDHHLADVRGYVYEHRLVAEQKLGRPLLPDEIVHHVNEVIADNRSENIEVLPSIAYHRLRHRKPGSILRLPDEPNLVVACECNCGVLFEKYDQVGRPRRFVSGHNMRMRHG